MLAIEETREGNDQPQSLLNEGITHAYIHEGALGAWAIMSEQDAVDMFWFMGALKLSRIVGNILGPVGDLEGAWEEDAASLEAATQTLRASDERRYVNPLLQHAAIRIISGDIRGSLGTGPSITERLVPIGGPLIASCFDQGYHTYAFSQEGEDKMRRDSGPIAALTARIAKGTGPSDLAVVHGPNGHAMRNNQDVYEFNADTLAREGKAFGDYLVPIERKIGPNGTVMCVGQARESQLPLEDVFGIDKTTRAGITSIAHVRINMVRDMIDSQAGQIGHKCHRDRVEQLEHLRSEVVRVIGRHRLIREQFYPQVNG